MKTPQNNGLIVVLLIVVALCGTLLTLVSQEVYQMQRHVSALENEKQHLSWEIRALNGEIAFLTRPDRLDQLSEAIAQSISPSVAASAVIIPAQFSVLNQAAVTPSRKPAGAMTVSTTQTVVNTPSTSKPTSTPAKSEHSFSSLLNKIGGGE